MQYKDKLGVYRVGDLKFYSKLEAIEMHAKTGIHPHWDFNEAVFSSYDWTQEPGDTILELYRQRAQQLRDKYDYIVLMFSGGADSTNVLRAFVDNDIKLDEAVSYMNYDATGDKDSYFNAEIFRVSIPVAEQLRTEYPWLKHRVIDLTDHIVDYFDQSQTKFDWIYEMNMCFSPNNSSKESLPLKIKDWADIIHSGKKFCVLWAHDKPRILHENGKFLFRFIDIVDNAATVKSIAGQQPYTDELFYWTPDLPEILIKQGHLIKNYLAQPNIQNLPFVSTDKSDLAYKTINGTKYWLSNHGVHTLIYPKWNINTFTNGKASSAIFTERDTWFFELSNGHDIKKNWFVGLDKLWKLVPDYWKNDKKDIHAGLKACWSKDYYLE
jgi:hypothetical protein